MDALALAMPVLALGEDSPDDLVYRGPLDQDLKAQILKGSGDDGAALIAGLSVLTLSVAVISLASTGLSAYHGYKRNGGSLGWGIWWGIMGSMFGPIPVGIAYAQGFGKRGR